MDTPSRRTGSALPGLVDTYDADLLYFDDSELPLGQYASTSSPTTTTPACANTARWMWSSPRRTSSSNMSLSHLDIERGKANGILANPGRPILHRQLYYDRSLLDSTSTRPHLRHSLAHRHRQPQRESTAQYSLRGDGTSMRMSTHS